MWSPSYTGYFTARAEGPAVHLIGGLMGPELVYTLFGGGKFLALAGNATTIP